MIPVFTIACLFATDWLLSSNDLLRTPTKASLGTEARRKIEDQYFATPLYDRDTLAKQESVRRSGFTQLVWISLSPRHRGEARHAGSPQGRLPSTDDCEVLRARLLSDSHRLYYGVYKPLLDRLMSNPEAKGDYRLLRLASRSCFLVGGDMQQALPLALAAYKLKPENPSTWWMMKSTYYSMIAHGIGNGQANWKEYVAYSDRCRTLAVASAANPQAKEDVREIDIDKRWLAGFLKRMYNPDGTLKKP